MFMYKPLEKSNDLRKSPAFSDAGKDCLFLCHSKGCASLSSDLAVWGEVSVGCAGSQGPRSLL